MAESEELTSFLHHNVMLGLPDGQHLRGNRRVEVRLQNTDEHICKAVSQDGITLEESRQPAHHRRLHVLLCVRLIHIHRYRAGLALT